MAIFSMLTVLENNGRFASGFSRTLILYFSGSSVVLNMADS